MRVSFAGKMVSIVLALVLLLATGIAIILTLIFSSTLRQESLGRLKAATKAVNSLGDRSLQKVGAEPRLLAGLSELSEAVAARRIPEIRTRAKLALAGEARRGYEEGSVVKPSLRGAAPVLKDGRIVGAVVVGDDLSGNDSFVDAIKDALNVECTVFYGETRVSTTILSEGKRFVGQKFENPAIAETVLKKAQLFNSTTIIAGQVFDTAYWPIA